MGMILAALWGSTMVRLLAAIFLGLAALKGYGLAKDMQGAARGRAEVVQAATKKADANVARAEEVSAASAAGKKTSKNPYQRAD